MSGVNAVATPGLRLSFDQVEKDTELPAKLHTAFRGSAARAHYLAADRLDVQFAAEEICRSMSAPTEGSWSALKRRCRYLVGLPRMALSIIGSTSILSTFIRTPTGRGARRRERARAEGARCSVRAP